MESAIVMWNCDTESFKLLFYSFLSIFESNVCVCVRVMYKYMHVKEKENKIGYAPVVKAEIGESSKEDEVYFLVLHNPNGIP